MKAIEELRALVATYLEGSEDAPRAAALLDALAQTPTAKQREVAGEIIAMANACEHDSDEMGLMAVRLAELVTPRAERVDRKIGPVNVTASRLDKLYRDLHLFIEGEHGEGVTDDDIREYASSYAFGVVDLVRLFERLRKARRVVVARFDVTGLSTRECENLVGAVVAQAEESRGYRGVEVDIEEVVGE